MPNPRLQVILNPEILAELKEVADAKGESQSEFVRRLIIQELAKLRAEPITEK